MTRANSMSHERIIRTLIRLGLSDRDAKVYTFLAKQGPKKIEDLANSLRLEERLFYQSLENLQVKGLVTHRPNQSPRFCALPFDEALEALVKANLEEAKRVEQHKDEILQKWRLILVKSEGQSNDQPASKNCRTSSNSAKTRQRKRSCG